MFIILYQIIQQDKNKFLTFIKHELNYIIFHEIMLLIIIV